MPKILLTALNAKYIHSCPAIYYLRSFCQGSGGIMIREFTINEERGFILREIYALKPDIIAFSCYIWNIKLIMDLSVSLKKLLPGLVIIMGGPEVSYEPFEYPADIIVVGEGEQTFSDVLAFYNGNRGRLSDIHGIAYRENGKFILTQPRPAMDFNRIVFPYYGIISQFANRIIYYESSRGCPFHCKYCLSGDPNSLVRVLPLERVYEELGYFLGAMVPQVKFIDRTFNCSSGRAKKIWRFLIEHDNGLTNFHFEIFADLLDDESINLLSTARNGMFQFEIGVQSTNPAVLKNVARQTDAAKLAENVRALKKAGNIHLHLDLIAGLPGEGYQSFKRSFDDVYAMKPGMLQLGFLKALKGTALRDGAGRYGIVYEDSPPYETLMTNELSFEGISRLKDVESLLDSFYNSALTPATLEYLTRFSSAFEFYESLAEFWRGRGYHLSPRNKTAMLAALYEYCQTREGINASLVKELLRFDLMARGHEKSPPEWLAPRPTDEIRRVHKKFADQMRGDAYTVQSFDYDICGWVNAQYKGEPGVKRSITLFRYKKGEGRGAFYEIT